MHGRRPTSSVAVATGIGAAVAVLWMLGTNGGRLRLRRLLGRVATEDAAPGPTHIELPDEGVGDSLSSAIAEGIGVAESITASPDWIAVPAQLLVSGSAGVAPG